jgi:hypothetical protein
MTACNGFELPWGERGADMPAAGEKRRGRHESA